METLGQSRMTWVSRIGGRVSLAVGKAYHTADPMNPDHIFVPFRELAPGRYELKFGRYRKHYPVNLTRAEGHPDPRAMIVKGHLPL
ncbi:MAG: hypothetical protein AMXMBFR23_00270 [Chloroflexota bacterium]